MGSLLVCMCLMYTLSDVVGVLGKNNTNLICSFDKEATEDVFSLRLLAMNVSSAEFIQVALFRPDRQSLLSSGGAYLFDRVTLSNLTSSSSSTAILNFQPLECLDETVYQCTITYVDDRGDIQDKRKSTNLHVTVVPSVPSMFLDMPSAIEGDNITFSCLGDVGRPPEIFVWEKRIAGIATNQYNATTVFNKASDSCYYHGSSNLTIQVADQDNKAIIRCSVNNLIGESFFNDSRPLNVKYRVRYPSITKQPDNDEYLQGSGTLTLTCIAKGNPQPLYTWYRDGDRDDILGSNNTIYLTKDNTKTSGVYRCYAYNTISGIQYTESTTVTIRIVTVLKSTPPVPTTSTTNKEDTTSSHQVGNQRSTCTEGIVLGVIVAVLLIALVAIVIVCMRLNRQIRLKYENTYDHLKLGNSRDQGVYDGIITNNTTDISQYENSEASAQIGSGQRPNYENHRTDDRYEYAYVNPADEHY